MLFNRLHLHKFDLWYVERRERKKFVIHDIDFYFVLRREEKTVIFSMIFDEARRLTVIYVDLFLMHAQ